MSARAELKAVAGMTFQFQHPGTKVAARRRRSAHRPGTYEKSGVEIAVLRQDGMPLSTVGPALRVPFFATVAHLGVAPTHKCARAAAEDEPAARETPAAPSAPSAGLQHCLYVLRALRGLRRGLRHVSVPGGREHLHPNAGGTLFLPASFLWHAAMRLALLLLALALCAGSCAGAGARRPGNPRLPLHQGDYQLGLTSLWRGSTLLGGRRRWALRHLAFYTPAFARSV